MADSFFNDLAPEVAGVDNWFRRVEKSLRDEYYFEAISICFNQINFILRHSILIVAKQDKESEYLDDIFTSYENPLMGRVADRVIYDEALRLNIIGKEQYKWLNDIHNQRNELFHRLFQNHNDGYSEEAKALLKVLAEKYFGIADDLVAEWPISYEHYLRTFQ